MTREEFRKHPEYSQCMDKIRSYRPGFRFTVRYCDIPELKANGLRVILQDACKLGLLESVQTGLGWDKDDNFTILDETFKRLEDR